MRKLFALCLIFALGLDLAPRTQRWRLLLMSEAEELAWSRRRSVPLLRRRLSYDCHG